MTSSVSGGFITATVVNRPERRLAKRTSVQFPDVTTLLEYRNNLEMSFNENGGLHVVEALEMVQIMKHLVTGLMLEQMNLFLLLAPSMH